MILLVRPEISPLADEIESIFQDWVLAYRMKHLEKSAEGDKTHPYSLFIMDGDRKIEGERMIRAWILELERELSIQRSVSGDGCYIDPGSGETC